MSKTPICDAAVINSEPFGYEVVPLSVARDLELRLAECREALVKLERQSIYNFIGRDYAHLEPKEAMSAWLEEMK